jgi:YfiH family protein
MVTFHGAPPTHLTVDALDAAGVRHAFTTRHHARAITDVAASPALRALGAGDEGARWARQVHGATCLVADGRPPGEVGEADALVTTRPGVPLAVFTADCLAVVLAEPERRVLALAHAGWRGTVAGVLGRLVQTLAERHAVRPERLYAAIGPSIGPCCYEVDEPVVGPLRAAFPDDWQRWVAAAGPAGKWWLDLWRANTDQLVAAGVPAGAIASPRLCTACRRDLFFSYRKEGRTGRLAALACLPEARAGRFLGDPLAKRLQ